MQMLQLFQASLDFMPSILAQSGNLEGEVDGAISHIKTFALLLAVAAMIIAGFSFATGRVEVALYALVGGAMMGLAPTLAKLLLSLN